MAHLRNLTGSFCKPALIYTCFVNLQDALFGLMAQVLERAAQIGHDWNMLFDK
jgi:hypothetical protein